MNMHQQGGVASGSGRLNAGIDVSKPHLDVCLGTTQKRVPNDADGWTELTAMLQSAQVDLVVVEATGGYEQGLVCALQGAGVCVARVNPRQAIPRFHTFPSVFILHSGWATHEHL